MVSFYMAFAYWVVLPLSILLGLGIFLHAFKTHKNYLLPVRLFFALTYSLSFVGIVFCFLLLSLWHVDVPFFKDVLALTDRNVAIVGLVSFMILGLASLYDKSSGSGSDAT
jgi:hypothetical protein